MYYPLGILAVTFILIAIFACSFLPSQPLDMDRYNASYPWALNNSLYWFASLFFAENLIQDTFYTDSSCSRRNMVYSCLDPTIVGKPLLRHRRCWKLLKSSLYVHIDTSHSQLTSIESIRSNCIRDCCDYDGRTLLRTCSSATCQSTCS